MFQLTAEEHQNLMFQNGTSSWGGTRKLPFVFTEQGVAMLSGVLNSSRAVAVNIQIMRVFTKVRKMFFDNTELRLAIEEIRRKTENNTKNIEVVFRYFDELLEERDKAKKKTARNTIRVKVKRKIGFRLPSKKKSPIAKRRA